jgi:general secretion pathway protein H
MYYFSSKAYSLIEVLVVLFILTLVVAIVPPFVPNVIASSNVKSTTRELASQLKQAQGLAIRKQEEITLSLNVEQHHYKLDNKKVILKLPDEAKLSLVTASSEQLSDSEGRIRFFPDGSSTGGQIKLSYINKEYLIDVHWLTGKVRILP